ncbi:hypothetical protein M9Y10_037247 [Tritrichomonas musculus]|uniref:Uncharacterized protein n=1 Tax=Tritrichomonas musculus TaxID=1915356 RepID=A0ABR2GS17_9EUKA
MFARNPLIQKISNIYNRPQNNTLTQERRYEVKLNSSHDYISDSDEKIKLWEEVGNFTHKYPEVKQWDEAMAINKKWYDFSNPSNKKCCIYFKYRVEGIIPESVRELLEPDCPNGCNDFISILKKLIDDFSRFTGFAIYDENIFKNDLQKVKHQNFFSWHYQSLCKKNRVHWLNGAWRYFVDILELFFGPEFLDYQSLRLKACTESNYYDFAAIFDHAVYHLRCLEPVAPMTVNMKETLNELWGGLWYFWAYSNEFEFAPVNKYPTECKMGMTEMEQRVKENLSLA